MDVFLNKVDNEKYKSTNKLWNELGLSQSWSLGFVSQIIKDRKFKNKEEWYDYYFLSGKKRLDEISKLSKKEQEQLFSYNRQAYSGSNAHLNYYYGRTKEDIAEKGNILYRELIKNGNPLGIKVWECQFIAFFRTVCETWNGIMIREVNTKQKIEDYFQEKGKYISVIDTSGKFDYNFAVDFELYYEGNIFCGVQVKPESYMNKNIEYIEKAHEINSKKNEKYTSKYNRPVFYIYSSQNGFINNKEVLNDIMYLLQ